MIYDCDPADTISALRAANEDLATQVKHWRGIVIADNPPIEELEFNLRATKSVLEIADGVINRLNGVIEKYRAVSQPSQLRENKQFNETSRDWEICSAIDNYRTAARQGSELTLSDFLKEVGWELVPSSNGAEGAGDAFTLQTPMTNFALLRGETVAAPPQPAPDAMQEALESLALAQAAIERQGNTPNLNALSGDLVAAGEVESHAASPDWDKIASEYMPATAAPVSEPKP